MNKLIVFLFATVLFTSSCKKDENCEVPTTAAPQSEINDLQNYISSNSIDAVKDSRGFFYKINKEGGESKPDLCDNVNVKYTGRLTNGSVFDSQNNEKFLLSGLILGWQEGIPLIGITGKITLYLPPSLAYGNKAQNGIPANSILIFDIELLGF